MYVKADSDRLSKQRRPPVLIDRTDRVTEGCIVSGDRTIWIDYLHLNNPYWSVSAVLPFVATVSTVPILVATVSTVIETRTVTPWNELALYRVESVV